MKIAYIPPFSLLPWALTSEYQLMLPQLTYSLLYKTFYEYLCHDPRQYVILDNGAAEGYTASDEELLKLVETYHPNELVLPDVIGNGPATYHRVKKFLGITGGKTGEALFGVVAAGADKTEAFSTVLSLLNSFDALIDVVYLPRSLVRPDEKDARIRLATMVRHVTDKPIHFLGASPYWIKELQTAGSLSIVRGMDTSAPFNYAFFDSWVGNDAHLMRPKNYFNMSAGVFREDKVSVNVLTMREWANGID